MSPVLPHCPSYLEGLTGKVEEKRVARREVLITIPPPHPAGYSVAVLHKVHGLSYVAGAPRHKQQGAVFELQKVGRETNNFMPVLEGKQVPVREGTLLPQHTHTIIIDGDLETPEGKEWAPGHIAGGGLRRAELSLGPGSVCLSASWFSPSWGIQPFTQPPMLFW